ncbi:MAG: hypothetical protein ACUVX9_03180 [Anaerolineae bacterium]
MARVYDIETPALLVDLDRFAENVALAERMLQGSGKVLRPHL